MDAADRRDARGRDTDPPRSRARARSGGGSVAAAAERSGPATRAGSAGVARLAAEAPRRAGGTSPSLDEEVARAIDRRRGGGSALPDGVRGDMEGVFGRDFSQVRVHADAEAAALNERVAARAFTVGRDVFFSAGAYQPTSGEGRRLLAHELTHVAQQAGAPAGPPATVSDPGDASEREADAVAGQVPIATESRKPRRAGLNAEPHPSDSGRQGTGGQVSRNGDGNQAEDRGAEPAPAPSAAGAAMDRPTPSAEQSAYQLTHRYYPDVHGSEDAFKRFMVETYLRQNFLLLMQSDALGPVVADLLDRLLLPTCSFSGNLSEGELVGLHIHQTGHRTLKNYYELVEPHLSRGEVHEAKRVAAFFLPVLEEFRTDLAFRGGFRNFRIRPLYGVEGSAPLKVLPASVSGKALLFEIEERGPAKGPLKKMSEGFAYDDPPAPRTRRIGYLGGGAGLGYGLSLSDQVEIMKKLLEAVKTLTSSSWYEFETPVHMRLQDFEGAGGVAGASFGVGGYKSLFFDCPELSDVALTLNPGFSLGLSLQVGADITGGQWTLDPDLGGWGELVQRLHDVELDEDGQPAAGADSPG